jgi:hypothetical protein
MAGSQATMASALTWLATQAAACCRAPGAAASAGRPAPRPAIPDSATVAAPATKTTATSTATATTRHRACAGHQRPSRRCAHNRTVVANTEPHDGSGAPRPLAGGGVSARTGGATHPGCPDGSGCPDAAAPPPAEMAARESPADPPLPDTGRPQPVPADTASGHRTPCPSHLRQPKRPAPRRPRPSHTGQATFA